jgi:hypothetical protein
MNKWLVIYWQDFDDRGYVRAQKSEIIESESFKVNADVFKFFNGGGHVWVGNDPATMCRKETPEILVKMINKQYVLSVESYKPYKQLGELP